MSAHTPGPWTRHGLIIAAADGSSVGEMSAGHPYISMPEQEANARLVAAAPDLLQAAKGYVLAMASGNPDLVENADKMARAAIAKATQS